MADALRSRVPAAAGGMAIEAWLGSRFTYLDLAGWEGELAAGRILRNGERAHRGELLAHGDEIAYTPPATDRPPPDVTIVHDDPDFVVVDKPPHYVVQRRGAFAGNTFVQALEERLGASLEAVHRLDRETSGLLVLAKNGDAAVALQQQFEAGTVAKRYLAIVHGVIADDDWSIGAPIGNDKTSAIRDRRAVVAAGSAGRDARTDLLVERRFAAHTLIAVVPHTGRTHQIRVHLLWIGHPLLGDKLYGATDEEYLAWVKHLKDGGDPRSSVRQMLHAGEVTFAHPRTGERMTLRRAPPADMQGKIDELAGIVLPPPGIPATRRRRR